MNTQPPASLTDAELSAAVAEKVAGWKKSVCYEDERVWYWTPPALKEGERGKPVRPPSYATDANAVLPLLQAQGMVEVNKMYRENIGWQWEVKVWEDGKGFFPKGEGEAPTFPRAACLALLRAHGWDGAVKCGEANR